MDDTKKTAIIVFLLAIVLVMTIGYAAFMQALTINGTATIDSTWDVHIESIAVNNETLGAKSNSAEVGIDSLIADFDVSLTTPGSSVTYDITVKNNGSINAKLDSISFSDLENDAIIFSYSGIDLDDVINSGDSQTFTLTITFNNSYQTMPENIDDKLTMYLTYVQA